MQTAMTTIVEHALSLGVERVYAVTIAPQNAYADGGSAIRNAYNAWLISQVGTLFEDVFDLAATQADGGLADNGDPTTLYAPFAYSPPGDMIHWSTAGHDQAFAKMQAGF